MLGSLQTEELQGCHRGRLIRDRNLRSQLRGQTLLVRRMWEMEQVQQPEPRSSTGAPAPEHSLPTDLCLLPERETSRLWHLSIRMPLWTSYLKEPDTRAELYILLSACWCSTSRPVSSHSGPCSPVPLMAAVAGGKVSAYLPRKDPSFVLPVLGSVQKHYLDVLGRIICFSYACTQTISLEL